MNPNFPCGAVLKIKQKETGGKMIVLKNPFNNNHKLKF